MNPAVEVGWMDEARCVGVDPEVFFFERGGNATKVVEAKRICGGCPVREECLAYAKANRERFGIWGGQTPEERGVRTPRQPSGEPPAPQDTGPVRFRRGFRLVEGGDR